MDILILFIALHYYESLGVEQQAIRLAKVCKIIRDADESSKSDRVLYRTFINQVSGRQYSNAIKALKVGEMSYTRTEIK
jgi:hypothetical protein